MSKENVEAQVIRALDDIMDDAFRSRKPSIGRLATVQSIVDLGEGWHGYREIQKRLQSFLVTGSVFSFQLVARYPTIFEREGDSVRIAPGAFHVVVKHIGPRLAKVKKELSRRNSAGGLLNPSSSL